MSGAIGRTVSRVDGPAKVTGRRVTRARSRCRAWPMPRSSAPGVASGRITSIDTAQARARRGRGRVLTHRNLPKVNNVPLMPSLVGGPAPGETFFPMQDDVVHYAGQPVAIVVADSLERAQYAATLVRSATPRRPSITTIDQGRATPTNRRTSSAASCRAQTRRGNVEDGFAGADLRIDAPFRFAANHHNPIEPPTTTAAWDGDQLTLYDSARASRPCS